MKPPPLLLILVIFLVLGFLLVMTPSCASPGKPEPWTDAKGQVIPQVTAVEQTIEKDALTVIGDMLTAELNSLVTP